MQNQWIFNSLTPEQECYQKTISEQLPVSPTLAKLLVQRGVTTLKEAKEFFEPQLHQLHDPFLMKDMDRAVKRLEKALQQKENILIYGDYDVDGTTAVALVYKFLQPLVASQQCIDYYIPDRYKEGYGISKNGVDYAKENNITLVIALDCGIKAIEMVDYANELGIDFIICDHHTTDAELPRATAVLDAKRADCTYPYEHLSGCGVGFKFMQAFAQSNGIPESLLIPLLDLVAVSIAADIVPITGENRILAHYGIKRLNEMPSCGLKAIMKVCKLKPSKDKKDGSQITMNDIVFKIGPRINASGRMESGKEVVKLLISNDPTQSKLLSEHIDDNNNRRRDLDQETTKQAIDSISEETIKKNRSLVVFNPEWHKGIVGIVASRLTEKFHKPTIVLTESNGIISGSARSVHGFDIYSAIDSCRDMLVSFGGHIYAAGLSMTSENLENFKAKFEEYVVNNIENAQLTPQLKIDSIIQFSEITPNFIDILKRFEPFGPGNSKPHFCTTQIIDKRNNSRKVGKENNHLKLNVSDNSTEFEMEGIAFNMAEHHTSLKRLVPLDIVYTIEENYFNGKSTTQILAKDMRETQK